MTTREHLCANIFSRSVYSLDEEGKEEKKSEFVIMRIRASKGFVDDRPREMNSRARNAISRGGEIYLARGGDRVARGTRRGIGSIT